MSKWTHVNASIRFIDADLIPSDFEKSLKKNIPCGSEGPLSCKLVKIKEESDAVLVVFGSLRDYGNVDEILDFFDNITMFRLIHSGILEIEVAPGGISVYRLNTFNDEWEEIN